MVLVLPFGLSSAGYIFFLNCYSINEILEISCIPDVVYLDNGGVCSDNTSCLETASFFLVKLKNVQSQFVLVDKITLQLIRFFEKFVRWNIRSENI